MRKIIVVLSVLVVLIVAARLVAWLRGPPDVANAIADLKSSKTVTRWEAAGRLAKLGPRATRAVPALIEALRDSAPNGGVNMEASKALIAIGADRKVLIPALVDAMANAASNARPHMGRALIQLGPEGVEALVDTIRLKPEASYETQTHALASFGHDQISILTQLKNNSNEHVRLVAVEALGRISWAGVNEQQLKLLAEALQDKSSFIRARALEKLGENCLAAKSAGPAMLALLNDQDPSVRITAAVQTIRVDPTTKEVAFKTLRELSTSQEVDTRSSTIYALGNFGSEAVPLLITALKDTDIRFEATRSLQQIGPGAKDAVPVLVEILADKQQEVGFQIGVLDVLMQIGPAAKAAVPVLIKSLENADLANMAAEALGAIGADAKDAVPKLTNLLASTEEDQHQGVIRALGNIGHGASQVVPRLISFLQSEDAIIREEAARAIGKIGANANTVVPALIKLLSDKEPSVIGAAAEALGRFGSAAKDAVPALVNAASHEWAIVNRSATFALFEIDPAPRKEVFEPLAMAFRVGEEAEQARAAEILISMKAGAAPAIPDLAEMSQHWDQEFAFRAIDLLAKLGPIAIGALPELELAVSGSNPKSRSRAAEAIANIAPTSEKATEILQQLLNDSDEKVREIAVRALKGRNLPPVR